MPRKPSEWIESFQIFEKYPCYGLDAAEHDEVYGGPKPEVVTPEDRKRLEELGWSDYGTGNFRAGV